jgi:hypothetical protein
MTTAPMPALTERPAHVPPELVYDVDICNLEGAQDDVHAAWKRVQQNAPGIFWTPRNGGYWMTGMANNASELWLSWPTGKA